VIILFWAPIVLELNNSTIINKLTECQNSSNHNTYNYIKADWNLFKRSIPKIAPNESSNGVEKLNAFVMAIVYRCQGKKNEL
jgi:hypothetical protein